MIACHPLNSNWVVTKLTIYTYLCRIIHHIHTDMQVQQSTSKVGYLARKRKLHQESTSEQTKDEYSLWLTSTGLANETAVSLCQAITKVSKVQKNKETLKLLNSMQALLTSNPILAQDLSLIYQELMRPTYDKLFRQTTIVKQKKQKS